MPRVTPPPPPHRRVIDPAVVQSADALRAEPPPPPYTQPPPHTPPPYTQPPPPRMGPVYGTVVPPNVRVPTDRARFDVGNPFGYVCARLFAFVLDVGLVSVTATSLAYSMIAFNPITGLPTNSQRGFDATLALGVAMALVYVWVAEAAIGTTIGKLATGLHVYAVRGGPVGLGRAFLRSLLRPIDVLAVGALLALLPSHRRLGDFAGGTFVGRRAWRGFGPAIGWVLVLIVAGIPFILAGVPRTFASLMAFYQFMPGLIARLVLLPHTIATHLPPGMHLSGH